MKFLSFQSLFLLNNSMELPPRNPECRDLFPENSSISGGWTCLTHFKKRTSIFLSDWVLQQPARLQIVAGCPAGPIDRTARWGRIRGRSTTRRGARKIGARSPRGRRDEGCREQRASWMRFSVGPGGRVATRYTKSAHRSRLAAGAIGKLDRGETETRTSIPTPPAEVRAGNRKSE